MSTQITDFITAHGITMTAEPVDQNPNMDSGDMDHWHCTFRRHQFVFTTPFSMGSAHNGKQPKADEVLDCLASDAAGVENADGFEDWAGEYGYDPDSRKAERIYRTIEQQAAKLKKFLGDAAYQDLLFETERL